MATLSVQQARPTGAELVYQSIAAGGDLLPNDGKTVLLYKAASGTLTVTATSQKQIEGLDVEDPAMNVTLTTPGVMGPFDPTLFNTAAGAVELTYSGTTAGATVGAVSL